jgi:hypothetical protein
MGVPAMTREEAEAAVPRVKAALAEVGYPDTRVWVERGAKGTGLEYVVAVDGWVEPKAVYMAFFVTGIAQSCWPCWAPLSASDGSCTHDPWTSERPCLERVR